MFILMYSKFIFFFKQKTAYEMRISDWSSDVCSSDLYVATLSKRYDAFALPSASGPAPKGLEYTGDRTLLLYGSLLGIPTYSLPVMEVEAMPLGLQFMGSAHVAYKLTCHAAWVMEKLGSSTVSR